MDECLPSLVVTENYVQSMEGIPIPVLDYENVGIAHLVHTGNQLPAGPVIRLTSTTHPCRTNELHPLEADIQRDIELKQKQYMRQQKSSVIVSDCAIEGLLRSSSYVQMQDKPHGLGSDTILANDPVEFPQILLQQRDNMLKTSDLSKSDHMSLPQIFHPNRQMIFQGKQLIIVPDNPSFVANESKGNKIPEDDVTKDDNQLNPSEEIPEVMEIPLPVQNYSVSESNDNNNSSNANLKGESDTEEEDDNVEPVCDYEPDPESTMPSKTEEEGKPNKCYMCFKSFRQKKNMYAHIRKIHSTQPKIQGGILCPLCKMHALRQEHLRNHFETLHDVKIEKEEKLFNNMEDFLSWKEYIERETLSLYVSKSSVKLLANNQQKTYYKCHRSGNYITTKKDDRKKKLKVQGSNKIGATCPAAMEVTENVHGVNVIFWKTHVGHDNDLAHLVLTKEDKAKITECLNTGVPWDSILEKIKEEAEKSSNTPSRLAIVSKQDLRNIKKMHDMNTCSELFPLYSQKKKVCHGRKPMQERMLRRASQSMIIEKADLLLNLLETTEVVPEFRPKVCLMIDNLISTVKRRAVKNMYKREKCHRKRRRKPSETPLWSKSVNKNPKLLQENGEEKMEETEDSAGRGPGGNFTRDSATSKTSNSAARKRGRPKKNS